MILVLSPHLDDAAFSCAGTLYALAESPVTVITCFTRSVPQPTGFALACQRDKQLPDDVDYMDLRRREDASAMRELGLTHRWWDLPEAPHRGYLSAPDLFAGIHLDDLTTADTLFKRLRETVITLAPNLLLYPRGAGNHADHLLVIAAAERLRAAGSELRFVQYYDQPYANRHPEEHTDLDGAAQATPADLLTVEPGLYRVPLDDEARAAKRDACLAYRTQVPFQFGDADGMDRILGSEEYFCVH